MNNQNSMTDEKLIQFYLNGDPNALATLVELYKDRIYRSIYSIVHDKYAAEEIFREVFIRIIDNLMAGKTAEEGNFLQWAIKIANGLCIEYNRKIRHELVEETGNPGKEVIGLPENAGRADSGYHESHGKIKSMIDMLPDGQREVMVLNHYAGLSFKEIADTMHCSLSAALDTMKFGLTNLRKLMTEKEIALQ
ncbi:MAG: sigma-70 family RNA polymerase sigma factor [Ferruginibacter sp.]|mgnify:CR=1 FL=1|nr:sigma-70 family RNA polymerase sigma factor [Chitinophagaceae bacterium]MBP6286896.1 sigma-70 family RNA polymerase sigma factor [Ferruginibacter sp.]MBU9935967.1 sigma-70 family RNA polymerase sigma factor [Ferruginibacter sp.]HQY12112.1 sigma-70 family RNA polymerase sigma factor [Ferruginibacter sp.]